MTEKTTLLPTAPSDERFDQGATSGATQQQQGGPAPTGIQMPRVIIYPGLEFDPSRKHRYGMQAALSATLIFISLVLVEMRDCNFGIWIDLDRLQALHLTMMVFGFVLFAMSMCGIADFLFQYKIFFLTGVLLVYIFAGLMIWMTYEAAVNPCVKVGTFIPGDLTPGQNKNVFSRGDVIGIIVLLLDIFATIFMLSAATNFYKRY